MGDVWLASDPATEYGYDKRVYVEDCSNWSASLARQTSLETLVLFTSEQLGLKIGCVVEVTKQFWLSIYTEAGNRRQGLASATLMEACKYADKLKVNLNLAVYGDETVRWGNAEGVTQELLVNWYSKFGFVVVNRTLDDKVHMTRFPR
jgi:GNAT superfamily N-acetyltransferase